MSSTLRSSFASRSARAAHVWRVLLYRSAHATRGAQCRLPVRPRRRAPQRALHSHLIARDVDIQ